MDYKDLNAIGIVRLMLTDGVISVEQAARYFPELRGSKDEKIRKAAIVFVRHNKSFGCCLGVSKEQVIEWLEKQGENTSLPKFTFDDVLALQFAMAAAKNLQEDKDLYEQLESLHDRVHDAYWLEKKPINKRLNNFGYDAEIAFGAKDSELIEAIYNIPDGYHAEIDGDKVVIKKGEKKPTEWSEEDKDMLGMLLEMINYASDHYQHDDKAIDIKAWVLKSLKDRVQPKQEWSDEDEEIYRRCICSMRASACGFPEEEKFVEKVDNWLKSLKERIQPHPKQEWGDEDVKRLSSIQLSIQYCREQYADLRDYQSDVNWLNELKNRVQS